MIEKIFSDCFTGKDGTTYDLFRFLFAVGFFALVLLMIISKPSLGEAGGTLGAYFSLGAGALYIKKSTEPGHE